MPNRQLFKKQKSDRIYRELSRAYLVRLDLAKRIYFSSQLNAIEGLFNAKDLVSSELEVFHVLMRMMENLKSNRLTKNCCSNILNGVSVPDSHLWSFFFKIQKKINDIEHIISHSFSLEKERRSCSLDDDGSLDVLWTVDGFADIDEVCGFFDGEGCRQDGLPSP